MTKVTHSLLTPGPATAPAQMALTRGVDLSALAALFVLSLRQYIRGKRLFIVGFLFLLPTAIAVLTHTVGRSGLTAREFDELEFGIIFMFIPHVLAPLAALLYASGTIQDEVEEQTLTYLLIRPMPKWAIYLVKLAATLVAVLVLAIVFTTLAYVVVHWPDSRFWDLFPTRMIKIELLEALALLGYCALFGSIGVIFRRSLVIGVGYIIVLEGLVANWDFPIRRVTVNYFFRVLTQRWLDQVFPPWAIDLAKAPTASNCVLVLLIATAALTAIAAAYFTLHEFRVKTPDGN